MVGGAIALTQNNQFFNTNGTSPNDNSISRAAKIAFWGSAIATFGDALQTFAAALAIEESRISDAQQQESIDKLQSQIDELKKQQITKFYRQFGR